MGKILCQRNRLISIQTIVDKEVTTTKPWPLTKETPQREMPTRHGKSGDHSSAAQLHRQEHQRRQWCCDDHGASRRRRKEKSLQQPPSSWRTRRHIPKVVFINVRRFNVSKFIPTPTRCNRYQAFGHKTARVHDEKQRTKNGALGTPQEQV